MIYIILVTNDLRLKLGGFQKYEISFKISAKLQLKMNNCIDYFDAKIQKINTLLNN